MTDIWNTKRQVGELVGELRGLTTGKSLHLPHNIKIGVVAVGRGRAARERRFAVVHGQQREFHRSATEAAVAGMNLCRDIERASSQG